MLDSDAFEPLDLSPNDDDRRDALEAILNLKDGWKEGRTRKFGELRWRPDLEAPGKRVLLLALTGDIPRALMRRLEDSRGNGFNVVTALGTTEIDIETLVALQQFDSRIVNIGWDDSDAIHATTFRSVADWIGARRISLDSSDLRLLAGSRLKQALAETGNVKGRLFEEALCLVFSQVPWLTVDYHAYRNTSEEIDIVLGIHATGHVAQLARGAVAVATAKNEATATGSATVKYLKEQIANRKDRCKLGFLCSANSISSDARTEILRGTQGSDVLIVEVDGSELRALIELETLDESMQSLIRRAVAA